MLYLSLNDDFRVNLFSKISLISDAFFYINNAKKKAEVSI